MRDRIDQAEADPWFRWRGGQVSRIEALSDGVFALAIALLAFGNVPKNGEELKQFFWDVPAFAACFLFLYWCWWYHFKFFRRYGLQDFPTVVVNGFLLFFVLFFINPLGYSAHFVITRQLLGYRSGAAVANEGYFIVFYAVGFSLIFACYLLLHLNAWRYRDHFELDRAERSLALTAIGEQVINISVGLASIVLGLLGYYAWAGLIFASLGVFHGLFGWRRGVRAQKIMIEIGRLDA